MCSLQKGETRKTTAGLGLKIIKTTDYGRRLLLLLGGGGFGVSFIF